MIGHLIYLFGKSGNPTKRASFVKNFYLNIITLHNFPSFYSKFYCIKFCVLQLDLVPMNSPHSVYVFTIARAMTLEKGNLIIDMI